MKKIIMLALLPLLASCNGEQLPVDFELKSTTHVYAFDWESNQIEPYGSFTLYKQGVAVKKIENIKDKHCEISLSNGDLFTFGVNYTKGEDRPRVRLKISKRKAIPMDPESGKYNPDDFDLLYDKTSETNSIGYNGRITKDGNLE